VCKALFDGVMIAQSSPEHPGEINNTFRTTHRSNIKKEPPQFSAAQALQLFMYVEALEYY